MKSPLERACVALCEQDGHPPYATMDGKPLWQDYLPEVRAVLEAIREPSEGMETAGVMEGDWNRDNLDLGEEAKKVWSAMIDAALKEG